MAPPGGTKRRYCPLCDADMLEAQCPEHHVPTIDFSAAPAPPLDYRSAQGTVFGERYVVQRALGQGTSGTVFVANQLMMNRSVALKVLHFELLRNSDALTRFYREARSASQLEHPNIVRVFDFGVEEHTHQPFIAMNFVEGRSLSKILEKGPIPERRAAVILAQVARALVAAHGKGVVHRDLKPENILISTLPEGGEHATVLDFGLARVLNTTDGEATDFGMIIGSPAYMSPEQAEGRSDYRSDLYSLGCILHECLAGGPLFTSQNAVACLLDHVKTEPPPLPERLSDGEPPSVAVSGLRRWLLEKDPGQRPWSAKVVLDVLTALGKGDRDQAQRLLFEASKATSDELKEFAGSETSSLPPETSLSTEETEVTDDVDRTEGGKQKDRAFASATLVIGRSAIVTLPPVLDDRFNERTLIEELDGMQHIIFDFDRVQRITSFGVREWVRFLKVLPQNAYYCFIRCHPSMVSQLNFIHDFGGRGELLSLYTPYECPRCHEKMELLIDVSREKQRIDSGELTPLQCARCRIDAELDDLPDLYFAHVKRRPKPSPPQAVVELLPGSVAQRGAAQAKLTVTKEVGESVTVFKLKGVLDARASLRRLADGVEGDALVDLEGVNTFDSGGSDKLLQFLGELQCDVHLVGVDFEMLKPLASGPLAGAVRLSTIEGVAKCERCGKAGRVRIGRPDPDGNRALCCGRQYASAALLEKRLAKRTLLDPNPDVERYLQAKARARAAR
jgi:serine/threonine protein kinase